MQTSDFDYELPEERIAQTPLEPRDSSRLLVLERATGKRIHTHFAEIGAFLRPHDLLVANHSRVLPARLHGRKLPGGGGVELLLIEQLEPQRWKALAGGKGLQPGRIVDLGHGLQAEVVETLERSERVVVFNKPLDEALQAIGEMPLPPYIHTPLQDRERYQTVYSQQTGSVAAPTAGLHFTPRLLDALAEQGMARAALTLHVGLGTFAPVRVEDTADHVMHAERFTLSEATVSAIERTRASGGRIVAVGTTVLRALESSIDADGRLRPGSGETRIFITPGHRFRTADLLLTNFHLPRSTLFMLVSAFGGLERMRGAYAAAIAEGLRFYSYGDACLISRDDG